MAEMVMEKGLALMLAAAPIKEHPFFERLRYMRRPSIEEGKKLPKPITCKWDALGLLLRPWQEQTHRSIRLQHALRNPHPFAILQVHVPGSWRKRDYNYPIAESVVSELRREGCLDYGTFGGLPYERALYLNVRGEEALYDYLAALALQAAA